MDFFFCIPIVFGCPTKVSPSGDQTPRICPRCHNASVVSAKSRMWFELCFVPLIPMRSKHIWMCSICQWNIPMQQGWEPPLPSYGPPPTQPGGWQPQSSNYTGLHPPNGFQPGYQPGYINQNQPNHSQKREG
ncbi:uncharacterized protein FIBRA_08475 [Fibroporia radiculosa]|uniref:Zinc-ribbon 15 domain-containing protein n=1 Tax=Fibroporia radiculosa TaxID=599839 RepID=J4H571_9APHY|nr:uncharacterized protein FIBRA_08475 [Fibroporia radiculosa]CCM06229.1 predicted protein [Fibroporia radiculosa]